MGKPDHITPLLKILSGSLPSKSSPNHLSRAFQTDYEIWPLRPTSTSLEFPEHRAPVMMNDLVPWPSLLSPFMLSAGLTPLPDSPRG